LPKKSCSRIQAVQERKTTRRNTGQISKGVSTHSSPQLWHKTHAAQRRTQRLLKLIVDQPSKPFFLRERHGFKRILPTCEFGFDRWLLYLGVTDKFVMHVEHIDFVKC